MQIDVNSGPPFDSGINSLNLGAAASGGIIGGSSGSTGAALANAANQLEQAISVGGLTHASNSS